MRIRARIRLSGLRWLQALGAWQSEAMVKRFAHFTSSHDAKHAEGVTKVLKKKGRGMIGASWKARLIRAGLFAWTILGFTLTKLVSLTGVFGVCLVAYVWADTLFDVKPLSLGEVVETFKSEKELLGAAFAAIIGYAALSTWKDQKRVELKLAAGGEILADFTKTTEALTDIVLYAEGLIELRRMIQEKESRDDIERSAGNLLDDIEEYVAARERLTKALQSVTVLRSRHYIMLASSAVSLTLFDKAATKLQLLSDASWIVHPRKAKDKVEYAKYVEFVPQSVVDGWVECSRAYHQHAYSLLGFIGGVNGKFVSSLFPPTWTMMVDHWRTNRKLSKFVGGPR